MIAKIGLGITILDFALFGGMMMFKPSAIEGLGLQWTNPAGKTEVRCYDGALSWSLAASLIYLCVNVRSNIPVIQRSWWLAKSM